MSTWLLDENVRLSRELAVAQVRIGEQHDEIATLRASLAQAEQAIAEMRGEMSELLAASDADTMLVHDMDRELTSTKASLGRAVEALNKLYTVWQHSYSSYSERLDAEIKPVLSDPAGQRANAEWAARGEVCEAAEEYMRYGGPGGQDMERTAGRREAKVRLREALRRLKEVQQDA